MNNYINLSNYRYYAGTMHYILRRVVPFKLGKSGNTKFILNLRENNYRTDFWQKYFDCMPYFVLSLMIFLI